MWSKLSTAFTHARASECPVAGSEKAPKHSATPATLGSVHRQNVPAKSCTPRTPKTTNKNAPKTATFATCGNERTSVAITSRMPRRRRTMRSGRSALSARNERTTTSEGSRNANAATEEHTVTKSSAFHASRKYAPGCIANPMAMSLTHISQKKTTVRARSRYPRPRPNAEPGLTVGSSTANAAELSKMHANTPASNDLSNATMNATRRNALCGENTQRLRCFMNTGGGSAPPSWFSEPSLARENLGRSFRRHGAETTTSRSGTPSPRRFIPRCCVPRRDNAKSSVAGGRNCAESVTGGMSVFFDRRSSKRRIMSIASRLVGLEFSRSKGDAAKVLRASSPAPSPRRSREGTRGSRADETGAADPSSSPPAPISRAARAAPPAMSAANARPRPDASPARATFRLDAPRARAAVIRSNSGDASASPRTEGSVDSVTGPGRGANARSNAALKNASSSVATSYDSVTGPADPS